MASGTRSRPSGAPAQSVLTVDGRTSTASAAQVGGINPTGSYSAAMTVGKKPGSVDPKDAFVGWLDALTIRADATVDRSAIRPSGRSTERCLASLDAQRA